MPVGLERHSLPLIEETKRKLDRELTVALHANRHCVTHFVGYQATTDPKTHTHKHNSNNTVTSTHTKAAQAPLALHCDRRRAPQQSAAEKGEAEVIVNDDTAGMDERGGAKEGANPTF